MSGHVFIRNGKRGPVWYAKYRGPDGRQRQQALGPAWTKRGRPPEGHLTEAMATVEMEKRMTASGPEPAHVAEAAVTFEAACDEYLRYVTDVKRRDPTTIKDYRSVIDGYLVPEFGNRALDSITPDDVDRYKERLIGDGRLSNRTIVRHLTVMHGVFKRAMRAYGITSNPASATLVERPELPYTGAYDVYTPDQVELLAVHAVTPLDGALFRTAAYTGLRQGELLALRWVDVDFVGGLVHVRRNYTDRTLKDPKGKRVRSVPMTPAVLDVLATLKDREHFTRGGDLVFASETGDHLNAWSLRRRYDKAVKAAGLPRVRFHDLRHTFGTYAVKAMDGFAVQAYMGHQHYSTTQRYLHHAPRPDDAARLAGAFETTSSPTSSRTRTSERVEDASTEA